MTIVIQPFEASWIPAVRRFNDRLAAGGAPAEHRFPDHPVPEWLPAREGRKIFQEFFLATENDEVRGAYILKHQDFSLGGQIRSIGYIHQPLSEGIVNRAFAGVAVHLLRHALKTQPLLYALGMGGLEQPLPRMLRAMGWTLSLVPFYFKVFRPTRFLREIRAVRTSPFRRHVLDFAARSGLGWLAIKILQAAVAKGRRTDRRAHIETVSGFADWADSVWDQHKHRYSMVGVRDRETLNILYPGSNGRFIRLRLRHEGNGQGWAVVLDTQMSENNFFGDLRVGTIVDCFSAPEEARAVMQAATGVLESRGVEVVVANMAHESWCSALESVGFLRGPSNFAFAASRELTQFLRLSESTVKLLHLTRGDGDGPIHL